MGSPLFTLQRAEELIAALADRVGPAEIEKIDDLVAKGLPPIVSRESLSVMLGVNSGLIWSFLNRHRRHYRTFEIKKGK